MRNLPTFLAQLPHLLGFRPIQPWKQFNVSFLRPESRVFASLADLSPQPCVFLLELKHPSLESRHPLVRRRNRHGLRTRARAH